MGEKSISHEEHEKVKKYLHEEILKRDKIIDDLKHENKVLLKTSLKRAEELKKLEDKLQKSFKNSPSDKY